MKLVFPEEVTNHRDHCVVFFFFFKPKDKSVFIMINHNFIITLQFYQMGLCHNSHLFQDQKKKKSGLLVWPWSCFDHGLSSGWKSLHSHFSSVAQSCPTLYNPMDYSTLGFPVHHQLLELAQIHVHQVSDAIQPSHSLPSSSPLALNLSQH